MPRPVSGTYFDEAHGTLIHVHITAIRYVGHARAAVGLSLDIKTRNGQVTEELSTISLNVSMCPSACLGTRNFTKRSASQQPLLFCIMYIVDWVYRLFAPCGGKAKSAETLLASFHTRMNNSELHGESCFCILRRGDVAMGAIWMAVITERVCWRVFRRAF